jgi:hypothetical protein
LSARRDPATPETGRREGGKEKAVTEKAERPMRGRIDPDTHRALLGQF